MQFDLVAAYVALVVVQHNGVVVHLVTLRSGTLDGYRQHALLLGITQRSKQRIRIARCQTAAAFRSFFLFALLVSAGYLLILLGGVPLSAHITRINQLPALLRAFFHTECMHRVYRLDQLPGVLAHMLVSQHTLVHTRQVGVEIDEQLLLGKRLAAVRDILRCAGGALLLAVEVLKRLAGVQVQHQVLLVVGEDDLARVCHHNRHVAEALAVVV